jgi:hypothetical protein
MPPAAPLAAPPVVLLVDDRPENLLALRAILAPLAEELGVVLAEARSADEALRHALGRGKRSPSCCSTSRCPAPTVSRPRG